MNKIRRKLSLYPATYQIKVPGKLDERWIDWSGDVTVTADCGFSALPRYIAFQKLQAMTAGAALVRRTL